MLIVDIKSNIDTVSKRLIKHYPEQIRFSTSKAINNTLQRTKKVIDRKILTQLKTPTPFTKRAIYITYSRKNRLIGAIGVKDIQAEYLRYQIKGGTRTPKGQAEPVPVSIQLNKYGNIPARHSGKLRKLLDRPDTFSGTVKGVSGIWQRGRMAGNRFVPEGLNKKPKQYKRAKPYQIKKNQQKYLNKSIRLLVRYEPQVTYDKKPFTFYETGTKTINRYLIHEFNAAIRAAAMPGTQYSTLPAVHN